MSADKPVSLAERVAACCPCQYSDSGPCRKACPCTGLGEPIEGPCENPLHALEAEATEMEHEVGHWQAKADARGNLLKSAEASVEAARQTHNAFIVEAENRIRELEKQLAAQETIADVQGPLLKHQTKRVEALVEVLRSAPEIPDGPWLSFESQRHGLLQWLEKEYAPWRSGKRAAALADEPRKEA